MEIVVVLGNEIGAEGRWHEDARREVGGSKNVKAVAIRERIWVEQG